MRMNMCVCVIVCCKPVLVVVCMRAEMYNLNILNILNIRVHKNILFIKYNIYEVLVYYKKKTHFFKIFL